MINNPSTKHKQVKNKKYILVRYGRMGNLDFFEHNEANIPKMPTRVVIKTERGLELGHLVGQLCHHRAGQFKLTSEQVQKYFKDSEIDLSCKPSGKVIRFGTSEDIGEERHLNKISQEEIACCKRLAKEMDLAMKIVDAEHIFGGERIIFYFMAEARVDFRELVKKLAQEYQTRIEMRQIGARDEAKLLGDIESCGQPCCCLRFLKALKPVNMRMAKMQKATLDPSKISGYCGRLKCCLRYEDQTYTELKKRLPKKNTIVQTEFGKGKVIDSSILTQLVVVENEQGTRNVLPLEEIEIISAPPSQKKAVQKSGGENKVKTQEAAKQQQESTDLNDTGDEDDNHQAKKAEEETT